MIGNLKSNSFPALNALIALLLSYGLLGGPRFPKGTDEIIDEVAAGSVSHVVSGKTGYADSGGVRIWYESILPDGKPRGAVLLSFGMGGDSLFWPPSFLRAFVDAGYQVIRYDHRGTGMSDWITKWNRRQPYSLQDMAKDAVAVLDTVHLKHAHLVGLSLGGFVSQEIAISHPDRTASLTLMSTSSDPTNQELPGLSMRYIIGAFIRGLPSLRYRLLGGEKNLVKERIAKTIIATGAGVNIREAAEMLLYHRRERRGINWKGLLQHQAAVTITRSRDDLLKSLQVPTLVIHGTADQMLPIEHGRKLADLIPGAKRLWLEGVGHVFPYPSMGEVLEHIFAQFRETQR